MIKPIIAYALLHYFKPTIFSIKRVRINKGYKCQLCYRDINKGEYALYVNKHASTCIKDIEKFIDILIEKYSLLDKEKKKAIKYNLNDEYSIRVADKHISHYKHRIHELKTIKRYYNKNKQTLLDKSIIANI